MNSTTPNNRKVKALEDEKKEIIVEERSFSMEQATEGFNFGINDYENDAEYALHSPSNLDGIHSPKSLLSPTKCVTQSALKLQESIHPHLKQKEQQLQSNQSQLIKQPNIQKQQINSTHLQQSLIQKAVPEIFHKSEQNNFSIESKFNESIENIPPYININIPINNKITELSNNKLMMLELSIQGEESSNKFIEINRISNNNNMSNNNDSNNNNNISIKGQFKKQEQNYQNYNNQSSTFINVTNKFITSGIATASNIPSPTPNPNLSATSPSFHTTVKKYLQRNSTLNPKAKKTIGNNDKSARKKNSLFYKNEDIEAIQDEIDLNAFTLNHHEKSIYKQNDQRNSVFKLQMEIASSSQSKKSSTATTKKRISHIIRTKQSLLALNLILFVGAISFSILIGVSFQQYFNVISSLNSQNEDFLVFDWPSEFRSELYKGIKLINLVQMLQEQELNVPNNYLDLQINELRPSSTPLLQILKKMERANPKRQIFSNLLLSTFTNEKISKLISSIQMNSEQQYISSVLASKNSNYNYKSSQESRKHNLSKTVLLSHNNAKLIIILIVLFWVIICYPIVIKLITSAYITETQQNLDLISKLLFFLKQLLFQQIIQATQRHLCKRQQD